MNEETVGGLDQDTCKLEELEVKNVTNTGNNQQLVSNSLTSVPYLEISANSLAEAGQEEAENEQETSKTKRKRLFDDEKETHAEDHKETQTDNDEKESNSNSNSPCNLDRLANVCITTANRSSLNHVAVAFDSQHPGNKMNGCYGNQTKNKTKKRYKPTEEGTKENPINLI